MNPPLERSSSSPKRALVSFSSFAVLLIALHFPLLPLPYFWDEVGQFIPAALDIYRSGELVPHSTIPNVHPPGVMLWIAGVWRWFGCSIVAARSAMLVVALLGCWWAYRLALEFLCPDRRAAAMTIALLAFSPLFFVQSIMVLLDLPAMALTALALLMFFRERWISSAVACTLLVLTKETGALVPAVLGIALAWQRRWREAVLFVIPALPLAGWILLLHQRTGSWFGNSDFAQYNLRYPLNPVRLAMAMFRRAYYLFIGTGYLIGTIALWRKWRAVEWPRAWRIAGVFVTVHVIAMCVLGGAVLERYLLPVLPVVLAAFANALCTLPAPVRNGIFAALCLLSGICIFVNPIYPFPLENNLAWTHYVGVQQNAAQYLSTHLPAGATIVSTFPFTNCLRRPEVGYTSQPFAVEDVPDFTRPSLSKLRGRKIDAFAIFTSTWDPLGLEHNATWVRFLERFYNYERDVTPEEIPGLLGLHRVAHFEHKGQWIELFEP
jgi:hypothetical protein